MEQTPLLHLLYSYTRLDHLPPASRIAIQIWRAKTRQMAWKARLTKQTPLWHGTYLKSATSLSGFRRWDLMGISTLGDVMRGTTLKSFQQLQSDFGLHKSQIFTAPPRTFPPDPKPRDPPRVSPLEGRLLMGDLSLHKI